MERNQFIRAVILLGCILSGVVALAEGPYSDNSPPVMLLDRSWTVYASDAVGALVTRVRAEDSEGDALAFGLERSAFDVPSRALPFHIDSRTGQVTVNDSLADWVGEKMTLYVTVTDGKLTVKTEVFAQIVGEGDDGGGGPVGGGSSGGRPPPPPPPLQRPRPQPFPPPGPFTHQVFKPRPSAPPPAAPPLPPQHALPSGTTKLVTVAYPPTTGGASFPSSGNTSYPAWTHSPPAPSVPAASPHPASNISSLAGVQTASTEGNASAGNGGGKAGADVAGPAAAAAVAAACALVVAAGGAAWLLRRRLCPRLATKGTKDDMQKEPSGGLVLEEPTALRHWRGPRANSNRYEWDRDPGAQQNPMPGGGGGGGGGGDLSKEGDRWEFPRHRLKVFNILGEGCFGQVWRCEAMDIDGLEGPTVVAVKTLKESAAEKERVDLLQELQVMKALEPHPNVVRLLGSCTDKDPLFVIMEFVALGKLQSFLRASRAERCYGNLHGASASLTSRDLTRFAHQVARGMDFLSSKGIIHRDLAARNVLLGEGHICKVADFGFARDVASSLVYERKSEGRLPIRWMAPESLYDNVFSVKSDVWSFGVFMWEVVTLGSTPYPGLAAADVMRRVRDGFRLDKPDHCRRELYNIMYYCWDKDPVERPTFKELVTLLEPLLLTETDYIELERFPDHSYYNMVSLSGEKL